MSDRSLWLSEWCPTCRTAPGTRCRPLAYRRSSGRTLGSQLLLHVTRGWRARRCPTCKALPGDPCPTPSGREASRVHEARLRPGRAELVAETAVWEELDRRGATLAEVAFSGRAGRGGSIDAITLTRLVGDEAKRSRHDWDDELAGALAAPVWQRYGAFAGQPAIAGWVSWRVAGREISIVGRRGDARFEECVA